MIQLAKKKLKSSNRRPTRFTIILISSIVLIVGGLGYLVTSGLTPVNSNHMVFQAPHNVYLKAFKTPSEGYQFATQSVKGGKGPAFTGMRDPVITVEKDSLVALHLINEDRGVTNSLGTHNINIDEFNVHSDDLHYFNTQSITFLADKKGTFDYYCNIHPEMRGQIVVE